MNSVFRKCLSGVKPIRFREPLAETLGAFEESGAVLDYSFVDVVKMAGHACPTVSAAYLCCHLALTKLYGEAIPVRGEIAVTVYGEPDEGVYGVMAQVFSFLTGAAPSSGFHGLGHRFKRKDLLKFSKEVVDPEAMCFEFKRLDSGKTVLVKFYARQVPFPVNKQRRMGELMQPIIWEAATEQQKREFQDLWIDKIEHMLLAREGIQNWIKIEERGEQK